MGGVEGDSLLATFVEIAYGVSHGTDNPVPTAWETYLAESGDAHSVLWERSHGAVLRILVSRRPDIPGGMISSSVWVIHLAYLTLVPPNPKERDAVALVIFACLVQIA